MPAISIIIPIYNAEKYIKRCIESILQQTFDDFEIIAVFDGSTDKSMTIVEELANKDNRIKIVSQKNKGVSTARNSGIKAAEGKHITFIDADDYVEPDFIDNLYLHKDKDLVILGYNFIRSNGTERRLLDDKLVTLDNPHNAKLVIENKFLREVWGKLYSADIIKKNNLTFPVNIWLTEDSYFIFEYLMHCKSVKFGNHVGYNYTAPPIDTKYKMNAIDSITHLKMISTKIEEMERHYGITLQNLKANYTRLFTRTLLRHSARLDCHMEFITEIKTYTNHVTHPRAYSPKVFFRYVESSIILKLPQIGFYIRKSFCEPSYH